MPTATRPYTLKPPIEGAITIADLAKAMHVSISYIHVWVNAGILHPLGEDENVSRMGSIRLRVHWFAPSVLPWLQSLSAEEMNALAARARRARANGYSDPDHAHADQLAS